MTASPPDAEGSSFSAHLAQWGLWLAGGALAAATALLAYRAGARAQPYQELIAGALAWRATSKAQDYWLLFGLVFGFVAAVAMLAALVVLLTRAYGPEAGRGANALFACCALPALLWAGGAMLAKPSVSLLVLAAMLVATAAASYLVAAVRRPAIGPAALHTCVGASVAILVLLGFAGIAATLALSRTAPYVAWPFGMAGPGTTTRATMAGIAIGVVLLGFAWSSRSAPRRLRQLLWLSQLSLPLLYLVLVPPPWIVGGRPAAGYSLRTAAWVVILLLLTLAYADLARRSRAHDAAPFHAAVSPLAIAALLLYVKADPVGPPAINLDEFHSGESLVPWWSWAAHGRVPFADFVPARGLVNYLPGFFASTIFDGTAGSFAAGTPFVALVTILLGYGALAAVIGTLPAFVAFLPMPVANGMSEIDVLMTAALCLLGITFRHARAAIFLAAWVTTGVAAVLIAPGQGGLLVLSTVPLGAFASWRAWREERVRLALVLAAGVAIATLLAALTPVGPMVFGAVRYGVEQSAVNDTAHGKDWAASREVAVDAQRPWLWELVRASWVLVAMIAGVLILSKAAGSAADRRRLVYAVPIFLLMVLFVLRAAGRIDPDSPSRLGNASIWALSLLLPLLLLTTLGRQHHVLGVVVSTFLAATLAPLYSPLDPGQWITGATRAVPAPRGLVRGVDLGLPALGTARIDAKQLRRLQSIGRTLHTVLEPGETYLDLTNRSAAYFYLGYPPPLEAGAPYNLADEAAQRRAVQALMVEPPPLVLLWADNMAFAGGALSLRTHLVYRYLVTHYLPVEVGGFVYLVRPDRSNRLPAAVDAAERARLLDASLRVAHLAALPAAWGHSIRHLAPRLRLVAGVADAVEPGAHSLESVGPRRYRVTGADPRLHFDLRRLGLKGDTAGLLAFDFSCAGAQRASLDVYWGTRDAAPSEATVVRFTAETGTVLVPLDAAPRWLLGGPIESVRIDLAEPSPCAAFSVRNLRFYQRRAVEHLPR